MNSTTQKTNLCGRPAWTAACFSSVLLAAGLLAPEAARAATYTKANTTSMSSASDWTANTLVPGTADTCTWVSANTLSSANNLNIVLGAPMSISELIGQPVGTPNSSGTVINADGNSIQLNGGTVYSGNSQWDFTIGCPIILAPATATLDGWGVLRLNGPITTTGGTNALSKSAKGLVVAFANTNAFNGFTLSGGGAYILGNGTLGLTTGSLTVADGLLNLGGTTQTNGTVVLSGGAIGNGTLYAKVNGNERGYLTANLAGTNAVTQSTTGSTLFLGGTNNTYTGGTMIAAGTVQPASPAALPGYSSGLLTLGATGILKVRSDQWSAAQVATALANPSLLITNGGALAIDTAGGSFTEGSAITNINLTLMKMGTNTLTLTAANTYTNKTTVIRGTVKLAAGSGGSLATNAPLGFGGSGAFIYDNTGAGGALAQNLGYLTNYTGESSVQINHAAGQNQTLTFSALTPHITGTALNFVLGGGSPGTTNGFIFSSGAAANSLLGSGDFFNGSAYAWYDTGGFLRAISYGTDPGAVTSGAGTSLASAAYQQVTGAISAQTGAAFTNLNISGNNNLTLASGATLTTGGILKSGNVAGGATISGGLSLQATNAGELVVRTDGANDALTISTLIGSSVPGETGTLNNTATITGMSSTAGLYPGMSVVINGASVGVITNIVSSSSITLMSTVALTGNYSLQFFGGSLTKSGAGTLTLSGSNNVTSVVLDGGQLNLANQYALGGSIANSQTSVSRLTINDGTVIDNTSGGSMTFTANKYALTLNGSFTFLGSSGDLNFFTDTSSGTITMPNDVTITVVSNTLKIPSTIAATSASLTKNGAGTLWLGNANGHAYYGGLTINNGVIYNNLGGNAESVAGTGPVFIGGTNVGNYNAVLAADSTLLDGPITVQAGSTGMLGLVSPFGTGGITIGSPITLNNNLTVASGISGNKIYLENVISGTGGLIIGNTNVIQIAFGSTYTTTNNATVQLFNTDTYTGNTVLNSGVLQLLPFASINNSSNLFIKPGATLDVQTCTSGSYPSAVTGFTLSSNTVLIASGTSTVTNSSAATIRGSGNVSLGSQPIVLNLASGIASGSTTNPALYIAAGTLVLNSNAFTINASAPLTGSAAGIQYAVIQSRSASITDNSVTYPAPTGTAIGPNSTGTITVSGTSVILTVYTREVAGFSNLTASQVIQTNTSDLYLNGTVSSATPTYAMYGETVYAIIDGVTNSTTIDDGAGDFAFDVPASTIPAGTYTIRYYYPGDSSLTPATNTSTTLQVTDSLIPTIYNWPSTANGITYGQAVSNAVLNSDGNASVAGTFTYTVPGTIPPAGYGYYYASGTFTPSNPSYSSVTTAGVIYLSVSPLALTLTSPGVATKHYDGTTTATITGTLSGVLAGDAGQVTLAGTGTFSQGDAGTNLSVDTSGLTLAGSAATNYILNSVGSLSGTILPDTLTVAATSYNIPLNTAIPTLAYTITGYTNGDNDSSVGLSGTPELDLAATNGSPEGQYTITNSIGSLTMTSSDYIFALTNGTLRIVGLETWAKGNIGGVWDIQTSTNWSDPVFGSTVYYDGASVVFDDSPSGTGPYTVTIAAPVQPASVTFSNNAKSYSLTGAKISGSGTVAMAGNGTLTVLSTTNDFTGGFTAYAGTTFFPTPVSTTQPSQALGSGPITLYGGATWEAKTGGGGLVVNNIVLTNGMVNIPVIFGTSGNLNLSGTVTGNGGMTVAGTVSTGSIELTGNNAFSGGITLTPGPGGTANTKIVINNVNAMGTGTILSEMIPTAVFSGGIQAIADLSGGVANPLDIAPGCQFIITNQGGAYNVLWSGPITDGGNLVTGMGTNGAMLQLSGDDTYSGSTIVASGILDILNSNSLGSASLVVSNGGKVQLDDPNLNTSYVTALSLGGVYQVPGTYGSTTSAAANQLATWFAGNATITVAPATTVTKVTSPLSSSSGGSVTLTANVVGTNSQNAAVTVNEGTVVFTVTNGAGATVGTAVTSGTVTVGSASAVFQLTNVMAGTYGVRATYVPLGAPTNSFTASTSSAGVLTVTAGTSVFSALTSHTLPFGTAIMNLTGQLGVGTIYPTNGETVTATINGTAQAGTFTNATGGFFIAYPMGGTLPVSGSPYTITYTYAGDASLSAATNNSTTLTVTKAAATFSGLSNYSITYGTANVTLAGQLGSGAGYPTNGETVTATINSVPQNGTVTNASGGFLITYPTATLPVAVKTITYTYAGNANLNGATNTATTLTVTSAAPTSHPYITSIMVAGSNVILSGTNGTPSGTYSLWSSTNLLVFPAGWVTNATGTFDGSGNFSITNASGTDAARFYLIKQP